jgi:hypothetical protein
MDNLLIRARNDTNLHASVCDEYRYLLFFVVFGLYFKQ